MIESYEAKQPDELQLEESDVVKVSRKMADGTTELHLFYPLAHSCNSTQ